jgi:DnaJ family protein C protein 17
MLKSSKEKLNRKNDDVLHLSSDTLKRISHFYNKDSIIDHEVSNL